MKIDSWFLYYLLFFSTHFHVFISNHYLSLVLSRIPYLIFLPSPFITDFLSYLTDLCDFNIYLETGCMKSLTTALLFPKI